MSASNILRSKCGTPVYMGKNLPPAPAPALARVPSHPRPIPGLIVSHSCLHLHRTASAPEMLQNRPYNELVDVWAAGILLYIMCVNFAVCVLLCPIVWEPKLLLTPRRLSGTLPFYADNPDDFLELVLSSSFNFPDSEWATVSEGRKPLPESSSQISGLIFSEAVICGTCDGLLFVAPTVLTESRTVSVCSERLDQKDPRSRP